MINTVTLSFTSKGEHQIKGLEVINFNLKNKYAQNHSFGCENWAVTLPQSSEASLSLTLKGEYHAHSNNAILRECAFNSTQFKAVITLEGCRILGEFVICEYELLSRFDEFMEFEFTLVNATKITMENI